MSGRGKGNKGLGVYRARLAPEDAKQLFLRVLPKKYHKNVLEKKNISPATIETWLNTIVEGQDWQKRNLRQQLATQLSLPSTLSRFIKVEEITPVYIEKKKEHGVKTVARIRKKKTLEELVEVPHVKYSIGSPEYVRAMQHFQQSSKHLRKMA